MILRKDMGFLSKVCWNIKSGVLFRKVTKILRQADRRVISFGLGCISDDPCRIPGYNRVIRDVLCHDRACADNYIIADCDT